MYRESTSNDKSMIGLLHSITYAYNQLERGEGQVSRSTRTVVVVGQNASIAHVTTGIFLHVNW